MALGEMLMKRIFKSKLWLVLTGLLFVAGMAVPFVVNSINSHGVLTPNTAPASATAVNSAFPDLPPGFAKKQLANGLKNPSVFAFAPNGDIYIGEQSGAILIYRNGAVLPTPVVTLNTDGSGEKGLLVLALDPHFPTNGYMYVSYTTLSLHAQLSCLNGQNDTASLASEKVHLNGTQLQNTHASVNH